MDVVTGVDDGCFAGGFASEDDTIGADGSHNKIEDQQGRVLLDSLRKERGGWAGRYSAAEGASGPYRFRPGVASAWVTKGRGCVEAPDGPPGVISF